MKKMKALKAYGGFKTGDIVSRKDSTAVFRCGSFTPNGCVELEEDITGNGLIRVRMDLVTNIVLVKAA